MYPVHRHGSWHRDRRFGQRGYVPGGIPDGVWAIQGTQDDPSAAHGALWMFLGEINQSRSTGDPSPGPAAAGFGVSTRNAEPEAGWGTP